MKRQLTGLLAGASMLLLSTGILQAAGKDELVYASTKDIRNINPHLYLGEMAAQGMVFEPHGPEPVSGAGARERLYPGQAFSFSRHSVSNLKAPD